MKLYIPTCTLNFNNIFSTESISPASFYAKRGFGNKRYYRVEANDLDNVILLYSKYPYYHVENEDMENTPIVIEIETEDYKENQFVLVMKKDDIEVFASNSTIYLNPFRCRVFFESYQDLQSVLTKAEQSLENKYSKLYRASLVVRQEKSGFFTNLFTPKDYFDWEPSFKAGADQISPANHNDDLHIDRVKGCIICYLIGANLSISKETSRLKLLSRKMKNTLSAIVNSPNRRPTDLQDETLMAYVREFNELYAKVDENSIYNEKLILSRLVSPSTGLDVATLKNVLKDLRLEDAFYRSLNLRPTYDANDLYNCLYSSTLSITDSYNNEIKRLFDAIKKVELQELTQSTKKDIKKLITVQDGKIEVIDELVGKGKFYATLLNSLIEGDYKKFMQEKGTEEALSIAFVGGAKLKGYMENNWEGSSFQAYINGLLLNMQKGESFDIFSLDNEIMQSFAVFCQKGEDIDRLNDYMLQCGFSDYRFALGIYGATRGFAALPKTFTSSLINASKDYYVDFYAKLHELLFGFNLSNLTLPVISNSSSGSLSRVIPSTLMGQIHEIETKKDKQEKVVKAISETAALEDAVQSPKAFMYILDSFPNITRTKAYKNLVHANFAGDTGVYTPEEFKEKIYQIIGQKDLKVQKDKIDIAIELEAKRQDPEAFLCILDNYFLDKSSNAYKKISALIKTIDISTSKLSTQTPVTENRFTISGASEGQRNLRPINATSANFVDDINASNFILSRSYLPNEVRDILAKQIISFQNDYAPNGYYYGREDSPRTNNNTIKHFINKCTFTKGNKPSWIPSTMENKALLERLKQELYDRYANR